MCHMERIKPESFICNKKSKEGEKNQKSWNVFLPGDMLRRQIFFFFIGLKKKYSILANNRSIYCILNHETDN